MPVQQRPEDFGIARLFWVIADAIVGADLESERIVLWNPAAASLLGYTESEALGMRLVDLVPDELRVRHLSGVGHYRDTGVAAIIGGDPVEVKAVTKSGATVDITLTLADVSQSGDRRHVVAVIRDVSELRQAQRDLVLMNASMREFVATASHDLRTPLTSMLGFATALAADEPVLTSEQHQQFADAIVRGASRASRLVDDLLTMSQIQAGVVAVGADPTDLRAAVDEAVHFTGVEVDNQIPETMKVAVDAQHVERILVNYLTNAQRHGAAPIRVMATARNGLVELAVVDNGHGVPVAFTPRLFEPFAKGDPGRSDGTGLGLSIVRGLARAYGGDATYRAGPGGGAEFVVVLPAIDQTR